LRGLADLVEAQEEWAIGMLAVARRFGACDGIGTRRAT
jgi:hypothetical protein